MLQRYMWTALITLLLIPDIFSHHGSRSQQESPTQKPSEPSHVWRSMRTVWTFQPGRTVVEGGISDLLCRGGHVHRKFACQPEIWRSGCHRYFCQDAAL